MDIPNDLRFAIEKHVTGNKQKQLTADAENISLRYRTESGKGKRLVSSVGEVMAYAAVRMPATYGAVYSALKYSLSLMDCAPATLLDAGAGTGAASWAAAELTELDSIVCFEREQLMCQTGRFLMAEASGPLAHTRWVCGNLLTDPPPASADLVIASYVINEMADSERAAVLLKLWGAANMLLLIVEPGTPAGYSGIMKARKLLLTHGGNILAPCPHKNTCPIDGNDWCHFSCRVPRSRLHREIKGGEVPYEDEKYSYLAVSRACCLQTESRVLRHPVTEKGRINLKLCTCDGLKQVTVSKKDGLYKAARKANWGDAFSY